MVEVIPEFPDGQEALYKFLSDNLKYPMETVKKKIQGKVIIKFIVEKDGSITNVEVRKSVHKLLDE